MTNRRKLHWISYIAFLSLHSAFGKEVALNFEIQPNSGTASISFSTGGQDSTAVSYAGNIEARVQFDESSLRASNIEFTGESIQIPDTNLNINRKINYTGLGIFQTTFRITSSGLKGR